MHKFKIFRMNLKYKLLNSFAHLVVDPFVRFLNSIYTSIRQRDILFGLYFIRHDQD